MKKVTDTLRDRKDMYTVKSLFRTLRYSVAVGSYNAQPQDLTWGTTTKAHRERAEEFMKAMKVLYTSTICVSSDKSPTCSQILTKLEAYYSTSDDDNLFMAAIKEKDQDIKNFLQEATLIDPRFKGRLEVGVAEAWDRLEKAWIDTAAQPRGAHKMSALEQLFEDEDRELLHATQTTSSALSITEQVQK
ncbi:hypothetical protein F2P81_021801 [Scophthalmus maximus]|uniref:Uncharacterized protein n=1 Tax=Scophthalmus maximus TaxID=52904 RepID=A0A6A4RZX1_SCOMX|nr:hypothetical protein F2P81_021801 [Scophthalmus maximus]